MKQLIFPRAKNYVSDRIRFLCVALPVACLMLLIPSEFWLLDLLRHFRIWCGVLAVLLLLAVVLLRLGWKFAVIAALTALWQLLPVVSMRSAPKQAGDFSGPAAAKLKLLSYNLLYRAKEQTAAGALAASGADVLALQEYSPEWAEMLREKLADYPYRLEDIRPGAAGLAVFSKIPMETQRRLRESDFGNALQVTFRIDGQSVGVLVVHPVPPVGPSNHSQWQSALGSWPALFEAMPAEHKILAGDLNATPFCLPYQQLIRSSGLRDSAAGFGYQNTWYWHRIVPLGLPIDHLLISTDVSVTTREIGPALGSDHRWIFAELEFRSGKPRQFHPKP